MTWEYENAGPGNIALMAELPRQAVLALGFGSSAASAATLAISSLLQPFDNLLQQLITPMAGVAGRTQRTLCGAPRYSPCARGGVSRLGGCVAQPSRQDLPRSSGECLVEPSKVGDRHRAVPTRHGFECRVEVGAEIEPATDATKADDLGTY
jgi:Glucodextranase, domain N